MYLVLKNCVLFQDNKKQVIKYFIEKKRDIGFAVLRSTAYLRGRPVTVSDGVHGCLTKTKL